MHNECKKIVKENEDDFNLELRQGEPGGAEETMHLEATRSTCDTTCTGYCK
jgi:hypothetical protein